MRKEVLLFLIIILSIPLVLATPPGSHIAYGGNITELAILFSQRTPDWQGYAGIITYGTGPTAPTTVNATGSNVTPQGFHLQIPCNNPTSITGFILLSNSSAIPAGLVPGNLTKIDKIIPGDESGTKTFTQNTTFNFPSAGTINNVPTTYTYVNQKPQSATFREGYLNDAAGNLIFATEINFVPKPGYNLSKFSYQIMVAAPNYTTVPYYLFTDLNVVCPGPPTGGGGGGGPYPATWGCTNWTRCINNIQRRNCTQTAYNRYYTSGYFPPTERVCGEILQRPEYGQNITEDKISFDDVSANINITLPEKIDAIATRMTSFLVQIENKNPFSIENAGFSFDLPEIMSKFLPIHQFKNVFWNCLGVNGWSVRPFRQKNYLGKVVLPEPSRLSPRSKTTKTIEITPPAMFPKQIPATLAIMTGEYALKTKNLIVDVEVNEFDAAYEYNPETKVFTLLFIVDNRGKQMKKNTFIEFNLNKGRKTKIAELYGPYSFPADKITILSQEYKMNIAGEYTLKARLHNTKEKNEVERKCIISG